MKYFFTLEQDLPAGVGFTLWGREHIAWLCIAAAIGVLLCLSYRRAKAEARPRPCASHSSAASWGSARR